MASDSGTYTPDTIARRNKIAEMLLGESLKQQKVTHWAEGLANMGRAALGGYLGYQANEEQKGNDKASTDALAALLGGGSPASASPVSSTDAAPSPAPQMDAGLPRGLRNNNPLNIEAGGFTQGQPGFAGSDGRFAKFDSPEAGVGAANKLLDVYQNKHGLNTVAGILGRWAPAADGNNVNSYAQDVSQKLGIDPNAPITPEMRPQLIAAMGQHENGRPIGDVASLLNKPQQVASLNPAAGVQPQGGPSAMPVAAPQDGPPPQAMQPPIQMAQAQPQGMAGGADTKSKIIQMLNSPNPAVQRMGRQLATGLVQKQSEMGLTREQQASDPLRQLQIKKAERDLADPKNPESVKEFEYAKNNGFQGSFQDWTASKRAGAGEYGLQAIWGQGPDGKPAIIQLGKSGKPILTPLPQGFQPNKDAQKVDLGTHWGILDPTTRNLVTTIPKDLAGKERAEAIGKGQGEAAVSLDSMKSKMPGLEKVVGELDRLSKDATYTIAGQGINFVGRQLGMEPREAAVARSNYISMVDNQVLPLLRDTFGAAFTVKEGETLRNTLGDPDKTPTEKQVVLKSFIEQKRRDVDALERRVGGQSSATSKGKTSSGVEWSVD